jgi:hypothetical protein
LELYEDKVHNAESPFPFERALESYYWLVSRRCTRA